MHWLALHFPFLPLEVTGFSPSDPVLACAVTEARAGGDRVVLASMCAAAAGVRPGITQAAARALLPALHLVPRDLSREGRVLQALAAWALQFSAQVSLVPPDVLLVEVGGSRRLFGGLRPLIGELRRALAAVRHEARLALAPTPQGALLLVRAGLQRQVPDLAALHTSLADVPLDVLPLKGGQVVALQAAGLRRCGDLLALPRAALGRRLGRDFLVWWQRLLGEAPEVLSFFEPPPVFEADAAFSPAVETVEALAFPARRLLLLLEGFLRARQAAVQRLDWRVEHADVPATRFALGFQGPLREEPRILALLRERLMRLKLAAPAVRLALHAGDLIPWSGENGCLLRGRSTEPDTAFLDRLRARFGGGAVTGLCVAGDHRPEHSMRLCPPGERGPALHFPERPLWLLAEPRPLEMRRGRPWWGGALQLEEERERIETGWWEGRPVRRDYFAARAVDGTRLWIFLDHEQGRHWFLHGFFG